MAKYDAYPEYKSSKVNYLGDIPREWKLIKFGITNSSAELGGNYLASEGEQGIAVIKMGNLRRGGIDLAKIERIPSNQRYDSHHLLKNGDFLFNTRNSLDLVGKVSVWREELEHAIYNSNILRITFNKKFVDSTNFVSYLFNSDRALSQLRLIAKGTTSVAAIYYKDLSSLVFAFPPVREQAKIADFLDHETAQIDTLIEKQQTLIQLLKEKRQAVISHAVTKGLNPDVPMKDSGVEWLGEVPAHWGVTKFNYEIFFQEGPGILAVDFHEQGIPLLRIQNVKSEFVSNEYKTYLLPSKVNAKWDHYRVEKGDLIISCSASTGLVSEVDERTVGAIPYTGLIRLKPLRNTITVSFIKLLVQSELFFRQIENLQTGSTIQHFGPSHLSQMYIPLPPKHEQENIEKYVTDESAKLDDLIMKAEDATELMQERRTALISAAVTGKIDVRGWVAPEKITESL